MDERTENMAEVLVTIAALIQYGGYVHSPKIK